MNPIVRTHLTNGVGNNLFQYIYARLIAEHHNGAVVIVPPKKHSGYYGMKYLSKMGFYSMPHINNNFKTISIHEKEASTKFYKKKYHKNNFIVRGYFEDFRLYIKNMDTIRGWFPKVDVPHNEDLVLHLRAGDRLFYRNSYLPGMKASPESYVEAIGRFNFKRLHIVTDMPSWNPIDAEGLSKMEFHVKGIGGSQLNKQGKVPDLNMAVDYFNSLYDAFNKYDPVVRCSQDLAEDFNYMRSFNNILFQHSTFAWWAAAVSKANHVGVYGPWRPAKTKVSNLSKIGLPGWFQWGN